MTSVSNFTLQVAGTSFISSLSKPFSSLRPICDTRHAITVIEIDVENVLASGTNKCKRHVNFHTCLYGFRWVSSNQG